VTPAAASSAGVAARRARTAITFDADEKGVSPRRTHASRACGRPSLPAATSSAPCAAQYSPPHGIGRKVSPANEKATADIGAV
jgi:hypothetical protein